MSPSESGVRSVPLILGMSIALLVSSALVTLMGYFHPLLIAGGVLLTIGAGLIYTLDIGSSSGQYIGYQIIAGVGNGICSQIPLIASIAFSAPEDIALTTALVLCKHSGPIHSFRANHWHSFPTHFWSALRLARAVPFHKCIALQVTCLCSDR